MLEIVELLEWRWIVVVVTDGKVAALSSRSGPSDKDLIGAKIFASTMNEIF
jgi:hypothetical protein